MAKPTIVTSPSHFASILQSHKVVVADFYADWCAPCKAIAPLFEKLSEQMSQPSVLAFVKINNDTQTEIVRTYSVTTLPTFIVFRNGTNISKVQGADPTKLQAMVTKVLQEAKSATDEGAGASSGGGGDGSEYWKGAGVPRGYGDVTAQIEKQRCELLNVSSAAGSVRVLLDTAMPSALARDKAGKKKPEQKEDAKDWVESDTDPQLLLFVPFQSTIKLHTLQITSLPPTGDDEGEGEDDDEVPMRPRTIKLFTNKPHNLGFEEAEDLAATQTVTLERKDWNADGTASVPLRYVKFQNITSLVLFVVDGDGDGEQTRVDRIRLIGEAGEKRDLGQLQKIDGEA